MPMTDDQHTAIFTWIKDHGLIDCPTCGLGHEQGLNPEALALIHVGSSLNLDLDKGKWQQRGFAVAALSCKSCGQVRFFNLGTLGIVD